MSFNWAEYLSVAETLCQQPLSGPPAGIEAHSCPILASVLCQLDHQLPPLDRRDPEAATAVG